MSGGSLGYIYTRVNAAAEDVAGRASTPLQKAFAVHLEKVAKALHDLEWVWSCDYTPGQEVAAIEAVVSPAAVIETAIRDAEQAAANLAAVIEAAKAR